MIDQRVLGLRRAKVVIIQFLKIIYTLQFIRARRFIVPAVKEPFGVFGPRRVRSLYPLDQIGAVFPGRDFAHTPLLPVRATGGSAIRHQIAALGDCHARQRHRAIGRQLVRVQQYAPRAVERIHRVEHALVLQPVVFCIKVAPGFLERHAISFVIPKLGQPRFDPFALRNAFEVRERDLVLRFDPGLGFRRVIILQPAIRIGHFGAVIIVHLHHLARLRIFECRRREHLFLHSASRRQQRASAQDHPQSHTHARQLRRTRQQAPNEISKYCPGAVRRRAQLTYRRGWLRMEA